MSGFNRRRLIKFIIWGGGGLVLIWVALSAYALTMLGGAIEPLLNHFLRRVEERMPEIVQSLERARDADVRVVRDIDGTITLSGRGVPAGTAGTTSITQFRQAVAALPTPGTAIVEVWFDGAESRIPSAEVLRMQDELRQILAQHGLRHPVAAKDHGDDQGAPH